MAGAVLNPFEGLGSAYEEAAKAIIQSSIPALISAITPVVTVGLILYIMITGYMVVAGRIQDPISDIVIKLCKWSIIAFIALNASTITDGIIGGFEGLESTILSAFGQTDSNVYQSLDQTLESGLSVAASVQEQNENLGWSDTARIIMNSIIASIVMIAVIVQTVAAGAIIILAKASCMVVFALAPLMLAGLFFPQTAKFADAFFNQALNYTLTVVIALFFQVIAVTLFSNQITAMIEAGLETIGLKALGKLCILAFINYYAVKQAPSIAAGLAGGVASGTASLMGAARNAAAVGTGMGKTGAAVNNNLIKPTLGAGGRAAKWGWNKVAPARNQVAATTSSAASRATAAASRMASNATSRVSNVIRRVNKR